MKKDELTSVKLSSPMTQNMGTVYDLNKQLVEQTEHPLRGKAYSNKFENNFIPYLNKHNGNIFMLLCNEKKDYTVFSVADREYVDEVLTNFKSSLKECFDNRGQLYDINPTDDGFALEFWMKHDDDGEMYCYYFFPYDEGIIYI